MMELLEAHYTMIHRYKDLLINSVVPDTLDKEHWIKFCDLALSLDNTDKLSRWLGFIQGLLFANGLITVDGERDFSRAIYKPIYESMGLDTATRNVQ